MWDTQNSLVLSLLAIWRTLRSLPYPCKSLAERIFLAKHVWRRKRICAALTKMSKAWEYQFPRRNATKEHSSSGNLRRMGRLLHGSLPNVRAVQVHSCGSGLLLTATISHFDHQLLGNKLSLAPCSIHILLNPNKFHKLCWFEMVCRIVLRICKKQH